LDDIIDQISFLKSKAVNDQFVMLAGDYGKTVRLLKEAVAIDAVFALG